MTYEELLYDRIKRFREIDERIERVMANMGQCLAWTELRYLRDDLAAMIRLAEEDYEAF